MKRQLLESEKNMLKCSAMTMIVGISLIPLGQATAGVVFICFAVVFFVTALYMIKLENDREKEKASGKDKEGKSKPINKKTVEKTGK